MSRSTFILIAILFIAALARIGFTSVAIGWNAPLIGDETHYHMLANNMAQGRGFVTESGRPTAYRPPGYVALLAATYKITGPSPATARAQQVLLGVGVVLLVFLLARELFGELTARLAAGIVALNPLLVFISGYMLTENLYMIFILSGAWICIRCGGVLDTWQRCAAAGVLFGVAALVRPTALPIAAVTAVTLVFLSSDPWMTRIRRVAIFGIGVMILVLPWSIRNADRLGGWVGITSHGGITFYQGNNARVLDIPNYRGNVAPLSALPDWEAIATMTELERNEYAYGQGMQFLRDNVTSIPKMMWWRFLRLWRVKSDVGMSGIKSGWWFGGNATLGNLVSRFDAGFIYAIIVFPLFLWGLYWTRLRWRQLTPLYTIIFVHTAVAMVFFGSLRGRMPIEPVIAIFAAASVVAILKKFRERNYRQSPAKTSTQ